MTTDDHNDTCRCLVSVCKRKSVYGKLLSKTPEKRTEAHCIKTLLYALCNQQCEMHRQIQLYIFVSASNLIRMFIRSDRYINGAIETMIEDTLLAHSNASVWIVWGPKWSRRHRQCRCWRKCVYDSCKYACVTHTRRELNAWRECARRKHSLFTHLYCPFVTVPFGRKKLE